ncbi:hypothetical protein ACOI22_03485 [Glaciecola sp. 2405UD65-10]|uniref:hypothetical protein n=1 Tax=Glaciecola sp. 2405UD65-10 TaxID=3397244 RepID=UPI003B5AA2FF
MKYEVGRATKGRFKWAVFINGIEGSLFEYREQAQALAKQLNEKFKRKRKY